MEKIIDLGENKELKKKVILKVIFISFFIIFLVSLFLILCYLSLNTLFSIIIIYSILYCCLFYISRLILKVSPHIKKLIFITQICLLIIIVIDLFAHIFRWYQDAHYFFIPLKYDILSHFLSGISLFLICILFLSIFEFKYRIENLALLFTNLLLFLYEILEILIDLLVGNNLFEILNKYLMNSPQDLIMNFLGSLVIYLSTKKYLQKRISPKRKEKKVWYIFIAGHKQNDFIIKKIILALILLISIQICSILIYSLFSNMLFFFYLILYSLFFLGFIYIYSLILKVKPSLINLIYLTLSFLLISIIYDLIFWSQPPLNFFKDANYFFFPSKYDIISHFLSGITVFLNFIILLSIYKLKYRIENISLVLANIFLFLYEILEEIIEIFFGNIFPLLQNPFTLNSMQDIVMNFVGSFIAYIISKKYFKRLFEKNPQIKVEKIISFDKKSILHFIFGFFFSSLFIFNQSFSIFSFIFGILLIPQLEYAFHKIIFKKATLFGKFNAVMDLFLAMIGFSFGFFLYQIII